MVDCGDVDGIRCKRNGAVCGYYITGDPSYRCPYDMNRPVRFRRQPRG